jgi:hypothetical protein
MITKALADVSRMAVHQLLPRAGESGGSVVERRGYLTLIGLALFAIDRSARNPMRSPNA